ncbi:MAG TPA: hypothetical protein DHU93_06015, partial [Algoriphagus sp.]|nr:hypothetical protein [Algoriphagus sp.]
MRKIAFPPALLVFFLLLIGCSDSNHEQLFDSSKLPKKSIEEVEHIIEAFIMAEDSSVIEIPEGFYELNTQLILDNKSNVTIKGAGMMKTVLSFRGLKTGGE